MRDPNSESASATRANPGPLAPLVVPDLWQQEAVAALRSGQDVVVHAPTGAGKTLVFEVWSNGGKPRGRAVYTVPTRALANDKLAEWRARGWNVGISTGDLAENLDAPILVATLETQKHRLIQGDGPDLLVVDEYQMLGDPDRGLNYELAIALAPPTTRLLLLSGSVGNPQQIVQWLHRLGRGAALVRHDTRPVPLEEVVVDQLHWRLPSEIRTYWPRFCAKALADDLGPILLFAPRRQSAEAIASELARQLPNPTPLALSDAQRRLAGESLARLLKARVAYHHSGLSYAVRAGVIEPLAKAGQLRVVVATMGLAAGINFSLRSVAVTAATFKRDGQETPLRPDEVLQMFGRAGRRGLDETGYALVSDNDLRLRDAHSTHLARNGMVDWGALLGLMQVSAERGVEPFAAAAQAQERLFTTKPIFLGVEASLKHPDAPCGLKTDGERARQVRRRERLMVNSLGQWEPFTAWVDRPLGEAWQVEAVRDGEPPVRRRALTIADAAQKIGPGELLSLADGDYGRSLKVADRPDPQRVLITKWIRRLTGWQGREATLEEWRGSLAPLAEQAFAAQRLPVARFIEESEQIVALLRLDQQLTRVAVDSRGVALWAPGEKETPSPDCARCPLPPVCRKLSAATGAAGLWRRLGLVEPDGRPTLRGRLVSGFHGGDGLAVAAALDDASYPVDELVYDLANIAAGFRFCGFEDRWAGRLAVSCRAAYGTLSIEGYLENGLPPKYGSGAETVVRTAHREPVGKSRFVTEIVGDGDVDRAIIEWRSQLRRTAHGPLLDWPRWTALQAVARAILRETASPTVTTFPPLEPQQTKRLDHRLHLRRH